MNDINTGLNQLKDIADSKPKLPIFEPVMAEEEVKNLIHILDIAKDDEELLIQELTRYGVYCNTREEVIERIDLLCNLLPLYVIKDIKRHYPQLASEVNFHVSF